VTLAPAAGNVDLASDRDPDTVQRGDPALPV